MNCQQFRRKIILYIKHELPEHMQQKFKMHLTSCHDCRIKYDQVLETDQLIFSGLEVEKAPAFINNSKKKLWWRYMAAVAAIFLIVSFYIGQQMTHPVEQENNIMYQIQTFNTLMELDYDAYRIQFDGNNSYALTGQSVDGDFIDNYLYELNERVDYLSQTQF